MDSAGYTDMHITTMNEKGGQGSTGGVQEGLKGRKERDKGTNVVIIL